MCSVEGCTYPARSIGMCHTHYCRVRRNGDTGGVVADDPDRLVAAAAYLLLHTDVIGVKDL